MNKAVVSTALMILGIFLTLGFSQSTEDAIRITETMQGFGARALSLGGAYQGVADDYSAIYWNPAGLAQLRKMEFMMGISHTVLRNNLDYRGNPFQVTNSATRLNSLGLAFPIPTYRGSLVFAVGYQRVKDFDYINEFRGISPEGSDRLSFYLDSTGTLYHFWGEDVQKEEYIHDEGTLNQWSGAFGIDISPNASVGMTMTYWSGSSDYRQDFYQVDVYDHFTKYPANFYDYTEKRGILAEYSSFSFKFGALVRVGKVIRLGIGMQPPQTFHVTENYRLNSSISFDDGEFIPLDDLAGEFKYRVKMPFRFDAGLSLALGPILATGSAEYIDWTQLKFDVSDDERYDPDYQDLLDQNRLFKDNYRPTLKLSVGGEIGLPFLASQFRGGLTYDQSPDKHASLEHDRKYISLGYGLLIDKVFKLDIAYRLGFWKQFSYDDLAPSGTDEEIYHHKLLLTVSYRF
jgi:long-subunit fatty acid transport protein